MKRFLYAYSSLLALVVPCTALAFGLQVIIEGKTVVFSDVPQSAWFATYVRTAAEAGIVSGYKDTEGNLIGKFGPSNSITVAEATKIVVESSGYNSELYGRLVSSGVDHWSSAYVSVAKAEKFAIARRTMHLDTLATRAQVASMFADAFRVNVAMTVDNSRYTDVNTSTEFAVAIEALSRDSVLSGDTNIHGEATGTFRPFDPINRAEVTKMAIEARRVYGTPGTGREPPESDARVVFYSDTGFSPAVLRIAKGEAVEFRNLGTAGMWVASDPHPVHTNLSSLDALRVFSQGESYFYTFTQLGTWSFHNHAHASHQGTIIVE